MSASQAAPFLTAEWRHLAMLNYAVDPSLLAPFVPTDTELDLWRGRAFLSLVAFRFLNTRVKGIAIPLHRDFDEINLRFYVRRQVDETWRRGVVFIKEIVPRLAIASVARWIYNENYVALRTRHTLHVPPEHPQPYVEYAWLFQDSWNLLRADTHGDPITPPEHSETAFITDHFWGYTTQRDGSTLEYEVTHPRWRVWTATTGTVLPGTAALYGPAFVQPLAHRPVSAYLAEGSAVTVHSGHPIAT